MKKAIFYIFLVASGILIGSLIFMDKEFLTTKLEPKENEYLAASIPIEDNSEEFKQSAYQMLGKSIIVNGAILEVYKNQYNESVIYLKDNNIPLIINCSLFNSEYLVDEPFKIGEVISLQGKFIELGDEMHLDDCIILLRKERER